MPCRHANDHRNDLRATTFLRRPGDPAVQNIAGVELGGDSGDDGDHQQRETDMAERDLNKDVDAIKADLDALRKDISSVLETIKGTAKNRAETEIEALQKRINQIASDVQTSGRDSLRAVEGQIGDKPLVSVAVAFAIGLMLGRVFDHRR
jgi:ElaB/YqjD/DUF883 family membrane-anchored ribosome-binding protein